MTIHESGCENLQYEFRYDASENKIELQYSFVAGVPAEREKIIDLRPVARVLTMGRKQRGRYSEIDHIFDNPQRMRQATTIVEQMFSRELGWAIDRAIQLLFHEVLYRSGLRVQRRPAAIKKTLAQSFERSLKEELGVKQGRPGTWENASQYKQTMEQVKSVLLKEGRKLTQANFAAEITKLRTGYLDRSDEGIDERAIRQWNNDYGLKWKEFKRARGRG